ncbi:MAG: HD domain-containing protein [Bradyrhizobium sp.]
MCVRIIGDSKARLAKIGDLIGEKLPFAPELLGKSCLGDRDTPAVVVAADLRDVNNISALKDISDDLRQIPKRVFLIDQNSRLAIVQAYALGATSVLTSPVTGPKLLRELLKPGTNGERHVKPPSDSGEAAATGAACIASMFTAIVNGQPIDLDQARNVGRDITENISERGLADWLATVRQHHEGTFQHCLLVTGIAVDFGLSLGLKAPDVERLSAAAMFHDIGKAKIPLVLLDKPSRLDAGERAQIETHPVIGYEVLKSQKGVSREILDAVRHHHEYLDGSGYPDKLGASEIGDLVRMLTVSDIFAALIECRSYKPVMPRERAYEILCDMSAKGKLEAPLVKAFREVALTR